MTTTLRRGLRLALTSAVAATASVAIGVAAAPEAAAAPCGNSGQGSSGNSSLGGGGSSGNESTPGQGPQGALPTWSNSTSKPIAWVTGPRSPINTLQRFTISGTDLGIAWDNGSGQTLMAFGDTFGYCNVDGQQWRHNVLLRADNDTNADLSKGLTIADGVPGDNRSGAVVTADQPNFARDMVGSFGIDGVEVTTVPTAAIHLNGREYINYMSVRSWGDAGHWVTNFAGIASSGDNGQTWTTHLETLRLNLGFPFPAPVIATPLATLPDAREHDGKFQQSAYAKGKPGSDDAQYVYQYGTPNGRFGNAYLARFRPADILDLSTYEYWAGTSAGWVTETQLADSPPTRVLPSPVGEISVAWSKRLNKYVMLNGQNGISLLQADRPEGPWTKRTDLIPPSTLVVYGPMMLPTSPLLTGTGNQLYFNASDWAGYNVMLIRSTVN